MKYLKTYEHMNVLEHEYIFKEGDIIVCISNKDQS